MRLLTSFILFLLFSNFVSAQSFESVYNISKVSVVGAERVDPQLVYKIISAKAGKVTGKQISDDIKAIFESGYFISVSAAVNGGELAYNVTERSLVRKVLVTGNTINETDLGEVLKISDKRIYDPAAINSVIQQAKLFYQSKGYYDVEITYETKEVAPGQVDLTFKINEGAKLKIAEVRLLSEGKINIDKAAEGLQTQRYKWWSSWISGKGRVNQIFLDADKNTLMQYLLDNGYIAGKVSDAEISREEDSLVVTFRIEEGDLYNVGQVSAGGDLINGSQADTDSKLFLKSGDIFSASKVREQSLQLSDTYADFGYAFANVVPESNVDTVARTVNLHFVISKGNPVKVEQINIRGNVKTYDNVIRRELKIQEQQQFSRSKVQRSEILLRRLGYFDDVSVTPENIDGRDDAVNLNVDVKEASTGSFTIGGGYSTSDGVLFNASLSENNFLGTGRSLRLIADLGDERENLVLGVDDRRFLDSYWQLGVEGSKTFRRFDDFDRYMDGANLTVGYPMEEIFGEGAEDYDFSVRYQYWDTEIEDVDPEDAAQFVVDSQGKETASGLVPRLVRNTIDNPLNPTEGSRQTLAYEYMALGGSAQYYVAELRNEMFYPVLPWGDDKLVFSWRFNVGYGDTLDDDPFPLFRRYFPGGINSVRGYDNRTLGPTDEEGHEYGGSKQLVNNVELIFPLASSAGLRGVVFYDWGQAFDDEQDIEFSELREAYGAGIRWNSPIGPFRIEFGFPVDKEEGESGMVTNFSIGSTLN